jgi:hypothetical protein
VLSFNDDVRHPGAVVAGVRHRFIRWASLRGASCYGAARPARRAQAIRTAMAPAASRTNSPRVCAGSGRDRRRRPTAEAVAPSQR